MSEYVSFDGYVHDFEGDSAVLSLDDGEREWRAVIDADRIPDEAQRGSIVNVQASEDDFHCELIGERWTEEEIEDARKRAKQLKRRLFGGTDEQ